MNDASASFTLSRELDAATALLRDLKLINAPTEFDAERSDEDRELIHDTVEGQTSLLEAIDACDASILEDEALIAGLETVLASLNERKDRFKKRKDMKRALIQRALEVTDQKKVERPTATLSLTNRAPKVVITDESIIPTRYWVEPPKPDPILDRKALEADLKAHAKGELGVEPVFGAELDNGSVSLTIRRK